MWRISGFLGRALNRCHASNIQGCVHGETEALNPSSLIPLGQNVGSKSYSSQSSGAHRGQNEQKHKKKGNFQFCTGQLPQYTVLDAVGVGAAAVFFLHLARQVSFYCSTSKSQEDRCSRREDLCSRRKYLEQIFSSVYKYSRLSVSSHILPGSVQSSSWNSIQLQNDAALQHADVSLESASSASFSENDRLHQVSEQANSYSNDHLGYLHESDLSSEENTSRPVKKIPGVCDVNISRWDRQLKVLDPNEDHGESINRAASRLLDLTETSMPTVLNIFGIISARDSADYKSAFRFFQESAESGYSKAQYNTAVCYEKGRGVAKDMTKAAEYYRLAASGGHLLAKYYYARHLLQSNTEERQSAVQLLLDAAQAGVKEAQAYLGVFYSKESHFDPQKAARYFWMAAENGDVQSRYHLGVCYERGFGVPESRMEALRHYERAAKSGHEPAQEKLLEMQQTQEEDLSSPVNSLRAAASSPCLPVLERTNFWTKATYAARSTNSLSLPHSMSTGDLLVMSPANSGSYLLPPIHMTAMTPPMASLRAIGVG
ncbi:PREDICTED: death ligand signal enhancer [Nanorana parkeri]|uniref:death ligand signal enhancer n=1 Tax=Nanorana parkeri TaxID=125878 RepID=UPI000854042F|nr:PREDICTED: death ligand signal enhancer [Nanorana parkeri]